MVKLREMRLLHMDVKCLPQMADGTQRSFLFVAIDRATCCMSVQFKSGRTARSANGCLTALHKACPMTIQKLLTYNGKEFTDRLLASREGEPSGAHGFV